MIEFDTIRMNSLPVGPEAPQHWRCFIGDDAAYLVGDNPNEPLAILRAPHLTGKAPRRMALCYLSVQKALYSLVRQRHGERPDHIAKRLSGSRPLDYLAVTVAPPETNVAVTVEIFYVTKLRDERWYRAIVTVSGNDTKTTTLTFTQWDQLLRLVYRFAELGKPS